jgi:hypothetical protein
MSEIKSKQARKALSLATVELSVSGLFAAGKQHFFL